MTPSRQRNSPCLWIAAGTAGALAVVPGAARADDVDDDAPPRSASPSAGAGAFLPSALSPRSDGRSGLVAITGGLDHARGGAIYDATAEAHLAGPVSLVAGAAYDGPGTTASPHLELRLDAARQATHGLDVAVAAVGQIHPVPMAGFLAEKDGKERPAAQPVRWLSAGRFRGPS